MLSFGGKQRKIEQKQKGGADMCSFCSFNTCIVIEYLAW